MLIDGKVPCDYGEKNTDLIGFFKDHISKQEKHEMQPKVDNIWSRKIVIPKQIVGTEFWKRSISENIIAS